MIMIIHDHCTNSQCFIFHSAKIGRISQLCKLFPKKAILI